MARKRRTVEPRHGARGDLGGTGKVPTRALKRPTPSAVEQARDTAAEARFWQTHEAAHLGAPEHAEYHRAAPSEVIHLRLGKSAIRRLKLRAAKAGLPFATYASSVLVREAEGE